MSREFDREFDLEFDRVGPAGQVRLVFDHSVDDHERPKHPLWRRYGYPNTQVGLLLFRDGTVIETVTFESDQALTADDMIAGGHEWVGDADSWQAQVLGANGYPLVSV